MEMSVQSGDDLLEALASKDREVGDLVAKEGLGMILLMEEIRANHVKMYINVYINPVDFKVV